MHHIRQPDTSTTTYLRQHVLLPSLPVSQHTDSIYILWVYPHYIGCLTVLPAPHYVPSRARNFFTPRHMHYQWEHPHPAHVFKVFSVRPVHHLRFQPYMSRVYPRITEGNKRVYHSTVSIFHQIYHWTHCDHIPPSLLTASHQTDDTDVNTVVSIMSPTPSRHATLREVYFGSSPQSSHYEVQWSTSFATATYDTFASLSPPTDRGGLCWCSPQGECLLIAFFFSDLAFSSPDCYSLLLNPKWSRHQNSPRTEQHYDTASQPTLLFISTSHLI